MLRQTTLKLSASIFGSTILAVVFSIIILMMLGGIGSTKVTDSSSTVSGTVSSSKSVSSSQSASSSTTSSAVASSKPTAAENLAKTLDTQGGLINDPIGKFILGTICLLVFLRIIYGTAWREGSKDPNRIKYGHMDTFLPKGLVAGLIATVPFAALTIAYISMHAWHPESTTSAVINTLYRTFNMQYILYGDGFSTQPLFCILLLLVVPAISALGYLAGFHNLVFLNKLVYKKKVDPKKGGTLKK